MLNLVKEDKNKLGNFMLFSPLNSVFQSIIIVLGLQLNGENGTKLAQLFLPSITKFSI